MMATLAFNGLIHPLLNKTLLITKSKTLRKHLNLSKDNVYKYYLDILLDMKNDQNLNYIFCNSDQDVFYKLSQITWK